MVDERFAAVETYNPIIVLLGYTVSNQQAGWHQLLEIRYFTANTSAAARAAEVHEGLEEPSAILLEDITDWLVKLHVAHTVEEAL
jgi:hypothetical protein